MTKQSPGCRHNNICSLLDGAFLLLITHSVSTAIDCNGGSTCKISQTHDLMLYLHGQLPGRKYDARIDHFPRVLTQLMKGRVQIGCCLTGTRLRTCNEVMLLQYHGDSLFLYGCGFLKPHAV